MADLEDVTLDGKPLQSLRVADLKAALEERGLSKSGQKNALIKRLKGALMLENLQRTSTPHIGLQPNSQIGEEMSQNSFIKQYLAKQQELLRQRLEREAREAYETNEQEDHKDVNNSTPCPPPAQTHQDAAPPLTSQHKPAGPSNAEGLLDSVNAGQVSRNQEADMSSSPASGSMGLLGPGGGQWQKLGSASSKAAGDSNEEDSEDGEEDGDDDDWDNNPRRKNFREPARAPTARERSMASRQPQQQNIPSLFSPQLRQPTPPPSPPPELSFPLPDTPKQSPPSPDVAPVRHSPSSSSSGSSSSGSRSSSPEPDRGAHAERKPGPLTLLARKMESEGAFSGAGWHGAEREGGRQDGGSPSALSLPGRGPPESLVSAISHTANAAGNTTFPMIPGTHQVILGAPSGHVEVPVSVLKSAAVDERDREREAEVKREKALQLERQEELKRLEQERAAEEERERERENALVKERIERQLALQREEKEKALQRERELALEKEKQEREEALAREREEQMRQKELERQRALEQEHLQKEREEKERQERERQMELERVAALEREREAIERAREQERLARERALEAERKEKERIEKERALEEERREKERIEKERAMEQERIEREKAAELERIEREKALEKERIEREKEQERLALEKREKERIEKEKALEQERIERERRERVEKEKAEREAALEQERIEKEKKEQLEREKALEERLERERALEKERQEKERALEEERMKALEQEKQERERAVQSEKEEEEKFRMAEKERESHLPPSKRGREVGLTSPPAAPLLSTRPPGRSRTETAQEDDHGPVSRTESDAPPSPATLPSHSSSKKFQLLRDSSIQPPSSSTSSIIKRPRMFSDGPGPRAPPPVTPPTGAMMHQEGPQTPSQQDAALVGTRPEPKSAKGTGQGPGPEEGAKRLVMEDKEEASKTEGSVQESTEKEDDSKPSSSPSEEGRSDSKTEEKRGRRRSSSHDSSSSESDSGSSSSGSSGSSASSQDKTRLVSRGREEGKRKRDSPQLHLDETEAPTENLRVSPEMSSCKQDASLESSNTSDGDGHVKKLMSDASTREDPHWRTMDSEGREDEGKQRQVKDAAMAESEKVSEPSDETPKAFSARKISLSNSKSSSGTAGADGEQDSGTVVGRKRRWGSSTAVTAKKPSISITTDSLKSLIPDIRPCPGQEPVVDLHPDEAAASGTEDDDTERSNQDLQIRRTVTQVVHAESQENGQKEAKRSRQEEAQEEQGELEEEENSQTDQGRTHEEPMDISVPGPVETQSPTHSSHDVETNTVTPSDSLIRRSISQQKTGVSITIDDPVRTAQQPSPPRGKTSNIVHVCNLVRPFTLGQLKELLGRTGSLVEEGFWIDKIKSHCYVTYSSVEEAVATRASLHGVKWPQSNPKVLSVDFCQQDELDFHKGLGATDRPGGEEQAPTAGRGRTLGLPPLLPERDQWAEREREMERRERARAEREWDRDKVREFGKPEEEKEGGPRRSRSRERRRKERGKSKEKKTEKKAEDPPAKLLDDLFRKTKAAPCIYWLPLTDEQYVQREAARAERMKEREKRRKELEEEEEKKREEERKERTKAAGAAPGDKSEGEKDKERERDRDRGRDRERDKDRERGRDRDKEREDDKRREGYRRPGGSGTGSGRRSRSRSEPRDRRR